MPKDRQLYGRKIIPHHMLNFAEQIYDIMAGEIERGRWKVGDPLPGVIFLAKELGFGTKTVQSAYDRLRDDGYTQPRGYRGTYLKSPHPLTKGTGPKIGVLLAAEHAGQPLILWYQHVILQAARRKGMVAEIQTLPASMSFQEARLKGALFGREVGGIICLSPFWPIEEPRTAGAALPLVFLCPPFERCEPKVCADVREAFYTLTKRIIQAGHTRIAFSEDSMESDPRQTFLHRAGFDEAMREHGLPPDESIAKASRVVRNNDDKSVAGLLRAIAKAKPSARPTAIVADSLGRSMSLSRVALSCGVNIPQDLSVVSIGMAFRGDDPAQQLTGMLPDFDYMVELCLMILDQQKSKGFSELTTASVRMRLVEGHTLQYPPKARRFT